MNMNQIERPTLIIDRSKVLRNANRMARKARASGVILRPHFKTYQSADLADWLREFGIHKITVSSVDMADYFSQNGWADISISAYAGRRTSPSALPAPSFLRTPTGMSW